MNNLPQLDLANIKDPYALQNFKKINDFFLNQVLFNGFQFFEIEFKAANPHFKFTHNLGFLPKDVIQTSKTGSGTVQFNQDLTTAEELDLNVSGACVIRFLAGTFKDGR